MVRFSSRKSNVSCFFVSDFLRFVSIKTLFWFVIYCDRGGTSNKIPPHSTG